MVRSSDKYDHLSRQSNSPPELTNEDLWGEPNSVCISHPWTITESPLWLAKTYDQIVEELYRLGRASAYDVWTEFP